MIRFPCRTLPLIISHHQSNTIFPLLLWFFYSVPLYLGLIITFLFSSSIPLIFVVCLFPVFSVCVSAVLVLVLSFHSPLIRCLVAMLDPDSVMYLGQAADITASLTSQCCIVWDKEEMLYLWVKCGIRTRNAPICLKCWSWVGTNESGFVKIWLLTIVWAPKCLPCGAQP